MEVWSAGTCLAEMVKRNGFSVILMTRDSPRSPAGFQPKQGLIINQPHTLTTGNNATDLALVMYK